MSVGQKSEKSKIVYDSTDPRFEQGFRFLVNDPNFQTLEMKVLFNTATTKDSVFNTLNKNSMENIVGERENSEYWHLNLFQLYFVPLHKAFQHSYQDIFSQRFG